MLVVEECGFLNSLLTSVPQWNLSLFLFRYLFLIYLFILFIVSLLYFQLLPLLVLHYVWIMLRPRLIGHMSSGYW